MISSSTRTTRSRYSSPAQQPRQQEGGANGSRSSELRDDSARDGSRTLMDRWLEPSVQNKTSYEQAGLVKYGVLENMAPLGAMPKAKKSGADNKENGHGSTVRRIILRQSIKGTPGDPAPAPKTPVTGDGAGVAAGAASAPAAPAPAPTSPPAQQASPPRHQTRKTLGTRDVDDDEDYAPESSARRRPMGRPSLPPQRGRPPSSVRRSSIVSVKTTPAKSRHASPPPRQPHGPKAVDKVVEAAVDEALAHHRYPTAWALRRLYDERAGDSSFVSMIEDVFSQTADARTIKEFTKLVEKSKRQGRKDNTGREYFLPPADDGRVTPHQPKAAPYTRLILRSTHSDKHEGETRATKKIKLTHRAHDGTPRKATHSASKGSDGASAAKTRTPSSRNRPRRGSGSSDSSLSSVENLSPPELPEGSDLVMDGGPASPSLRRASKAKARAKAKAGATGPQPPSQTDTGPITTRRKSLGSTKQQQQHRAGGSRTSESSSPITTRPPVLQSRHRRGRASFAGDEASMPGRLASSARDGFFTEDKTAPSATTSTSTAAAKVGGAPGDASSTATSKTQTPANAEDPWERRREAQRTTNGYAAVESAIRHGESAGRETTPMRSTRRTRKSGLLSVGTRATRSASKRANDEGDRFASPGAFSTSAQGEGSSVVGSRAVTPTALRPAKKQKTGLRVKSSPIKKKGGTAAGLPRPAGEVQPSPPNGATKDQTSDNDEYCSACGNAGDVVCCDACPRSFHFECVGMDPSEDLPDEWYCGQCFVRQYPSRVPIHKGIFGAPLNMLEKSIHRAFSLPRKLQYRFEGVKVGPDGDYEETTTRSTRRKTHGYEESPDLFKQREDGEAVLCHDCQKPASDSRAIISCSVCPLHWHMDCLDPPLAVPPVLKTWKCPAHADDLLLEAPPLAPAHRYRKIKGAQAITPAISRGLKNNGHIEIDWGSEPEDDNHSGWRDVASFGRVYKVSAHGVRLDFIEQLRNRGAGYAPRKDEPGRGEPYLTPPVEDASHLRSPLASEKNVEEMQASLVLSSLRTAPTDGLDQLTSALLSSAEPAVISLIAKGDAGNVARNQLADHDRVSLRALLAQMETMSDRIRGVLGDGFSGASESLGTQRAPSTIADSKASVDKVDSDALVTEPTPPSTIDHDGAMDFD